MKLIVFQMAFFLWLIAASCTRPSTRLTESEIVATESVPNNESNNQTAVKFRVETVASGLEVPWAIAFLPDGNVIFTERPGRVRLIEKGKLRNEPIYTVPDVEPSSESGLMDVSVHPNFSENKFLYLAYAYRGDGKQVKVLRYKLADNKLTEPKTIVENIPAAPNHAGTRARFGPDKKLYITTGDATDWNLAQKTDSLAGKTLRLNDDGTVPPDNPFVNKKNVRPEIWTIGHRNAQGLAWQPGSNLMFQTEHGPSGFEGKGGGGDEVNIVERGKNYGWAEIHHQQTRAGMETPLLEYTPACAPASGMFYNGNAFSEFKGNFFFGCLRSQRVIRVRLDGRRVVAQENLLEKTFGRIREIAEAPDGSIWFTTSNRDGRGNAAKDDDRILRLAPIK
ncbi:MAG: PQQ-dependent sugar dehydrogenase [Acidobacteriota bacterium]|nr:PQQ-dependent sugar dehydrogenase [Acidobacteriota bacterium]